MANLKSQVYKRDKFWVFRVVDVDDDMDADFDAVRFSDCIDWTIDALEANPKARRMSYDMWYFDKKIDAEKFQTIWLLKFSA